MFRLMSNQNDKAAKRKQKQLSKLKRRMQRLQNEMDFVEIFSHFWPLPNMKVRMSRMEREMSQLNNQYEDFSFQAVAR